MEAYDSHGCALKVWQADQYLQWVKPKSWSLCPYSSWTHKTEVHLGFLLTQLLFPVKVRKSQKQFFFASILTKKTNKRDFLILPKGSKIAQIKKSRPCIECILIISIIICPFYLPHFRGQNKANIFFFFGRIEGKFFFWDFPTFNVCWYAK